MGDEDWDEPGTNQAPAQSTDNSDMNYGFNNNYESKGFGGGGGGGGGGNRGFGSNGNEDNKPSRGFGGGGGGSRGFGSNNDNDGGDQSSRGFGGGGGNRGFGDNQDSGERRGRGGGRGGRGRGGGFGNRDNEGGGGGFGGNRGFSNEGGGSRGFGDGGGGRGFGNDDGEDSGSRDFGGGGGRGRGRGSGGFGNRDNNEGGGGSRGFGSNDDGEGGGSRGFGGGGGSRGFGNDDGGEDGGSRGFGGGGRGRGRGGGRGGGNRGFNDNDDDGSRGFGGGGNRGFGSNSNDNYGGSRGFGGDGGNRDFDSHNGASKDFVSGGRSDNDNNGFQGGSSQGFGSSGGDDWGNGDSSGNRGFGGGGNKGFGSSNNDGWGKSGGNRGFGGGESRGFGSSGDNGWEDSGGSRGFGGDRDGGSGRGRGRGGRGGGSRGGFGDNNGDQGDLDRGGGDNGENGEPEKPARVTYIPPERPDDDTLFNDGVTAGINFSKYDNIEVKTSGENVPPSINTFEEAGLRDLLNENISKSGYKVPTPIQKYAIPILLAGRDLMGCAQTGSGKTAAFLVPIVHKLMATPRDVDSMSSSSIEPRAVIVAPTRELCIQIDREANKFAKGSVLKCRLVYGGVQPSYQLRALFSGCDILVATPGRLEDFIGRGKITFNSIEFVVLDEADRMLDMGFLPKMELLMRHETMPAVGERQTLMFSATFPSEIQQLAGKFLHDYIFVAVGIVGSACTDIEQIFISVGKREKRDKLQELLEVEASQDTLYGILIFVKTKKDTDFLASYLSQKKFPATSIHGDRQQKEREEAISDFKYGRKKILVATSVAARGLDMKNVRHVINYDLPDEIDEYIHRIGRTGRVGNKGKATSFFDSHFDSALQDQLVKILTQAGQEVPGWLGAGDGDYGAASSFGGHDIRDVPSTNQGAAEPVEDIEEW